MKILHSAFTQDMNKCVITGRYDVHRHHVFYGNTGTRKKCELYGYIMPVWWKLHEQSPIAIHEGNNKYLDLYFKKVCQKDFEEKHGTREDFIKVFGRSWAHEELSEQFFINMKNWNACNYNISHWGIFARCPKKYL